MADKKVFVAGEVLTASDLNKAIDDAAAAGIAAAEEAADSAGAANTKAEEALTAANTADTKAVAANTKAEEAYEKAEEVEAKIPAKKAKRYRATCLQWLDKSILDEISGDNYAHYSTGLSTSGKAVYTDMLSFVVESGKTFGIGSYKMAKTFQWVNKYSTYMDRRYSNIYAGRKYRVGEMGMYNKTSVSIGDMIEYILRNHDIRNFLDELEWYASGQYCRDFDLKDNSYISNYTYGANSVILVSESIEKNFKDLALQLGDYFKAAQVHLPTSGGHTHGGMLINNRIFIADSVTPISEDTGHPSCGNIYGVFDINISVAPEADENYSRIIIGLKRVIKDTD